MLQNQLTKAFNELYTVRASVSIWDVSEEKLFRHQEEIESRVEQELRASHAPLLLAYVAQRTYYNSNPMSCPDLDDLREAINDVATEIAQREIATIFGDDSEDPYLNSVTITFKERG